MSTVNRLFRFNLRAVNAQLKRNFHGKGRRNGGYDGYSRNAYKTVLPTAFVAGTLAATWFSKKSDESALLREEDVGTFKKDLPTYSLEEVRKHADKKDRIWVTYKRGVYDVTDFVPNHPGGHQYIMLAAGNSVEPFWMQYAVHKNPIILSLLEEMRIGNLNEEDSNSTKNMDDPYANEPARNPALIVQSKTPFNAETPLETLIDSFHTPNESFYIRNHLPVPMVDPKTYELEIEVEGSKKKKKKKTLTLSLDDIKKLPKHTINATIMCAGNRRSEMIEVKPVKGLSWGAGAIGNASWSGARLSDVLKKVGIDDKRTEGYEHVQFEGLDLDPTSAPYGASIPIWKAVDERGDVLLAYEMNGQPLPQDHGFPVRVVVPGTTGARNVKWLSKIVVSADESNSHWQRNDYKGFSPTVDWDTVDFTKSPAIQTLPVISAICNVKNGDTVKVKDGRVTVKGYAWSGGGQKIVRVDVTTDGGKTWHVANFDSQDKAAEPRHWAWTLWSVDVPVEKSKKNVEIWAKAVDSNYNTQPESVENIWNLRGVLSHAYHKIKINLA